MQPSGGPCFLGHLWADTTLLKAWGPGVEQETLRRWFSTWQKQLTLGNHVQFAGFEARMLVPGSA